MKHIKARSSQGRVHFYTLCLLLISLKLFSQEKTVVDKNQVWFGYMSSVTISQRFSLWNDFHFVPESFFVARTGLTYQAKNFNVTTGYGFLLLPLSTTQTQLTRREHRPWAQLLSSSSLSKSISYVNRVRYDARFKQVVTAEELQSSYGFTNRIRFLTGLRMNIPIAGGEKNIPFVALSNEVLLNFGKDVVNNTFDQNRIQLSLGLQRKTIQYQVGYMNRFVQTGNAQYTLNHTVLFWVIHKLSLSKIVSAHHAKDISYDD
jgi:hypothetical protein